MAVLTPWVPRKWGMARARARAHTRVDTHNHKTAQDFPFILASQPPPENFYSPSSPSVLPWHSLQLHKCLTKHRANTDSWNLLLRQTNFMPVGPTSCWLCPPGCPRGPETLSTSSPKPSWPPPRTACPVLPVSVTGSYSLAAQARKLGGSLAHLPPLALAPSWYPISHLILSVLSTSSLSDLLSVSSAHWELGLLPPNWYPALWPDFNPTYTFNYVSICSFNRYWAPSNKHLAKCWKPRMKTEIMLALQELTVCTSREDHRKGVIKCDLYVYNYIYEHIL